MHLGCLTPQIWVGRNKILSPTTPSGFKIHSISFLRILSHSRSWLPSILLWFPQSLAPFLPCGKHCGWWLSNFGFPSFFSFIHVLLMIFTDFLCFCAQNHWIISQYCFTLDVEPILIIGFCLVLITHWTYQKQK